MLTPERAANLAWAFWAITWWAAAVWRKPAASRAGPGAELLHLSITLAGFILIFATPAGIRWGLSQASLADVGQLRLWRASRGVEWALAGATVAGFVFCWWARIHLGDLWSGSVTRKEGHRIIETGPYALVRHPIYTGLILSSAATAALRGTAFSLAGAGLVVLGLWVKGRIEERFLRSELGTAEYDAYAGRTPMLIPRLWPAAKS
jgi:protein-S-isoprenylcysteine O-methyltransferase Ste14